MATAGAGTAATASTLTAAATATAGAALPVTADDEDGWVTAFSAAACAAASFLAAACAAFASALAFFDMPLPAFGGWTIATGGSAVATRFVPALAGPSPLPPPSRGGSLS